MPKRLLHPQVPFEPRSLGDVFAVYLSRELGDTIRVRWYARLTRQYSPCLLLNALKRARKIARNAPIAPEHFMAALRALIQEAPI